MADLEAAGISMKAITDKLVVDAVQLFADAADKLLEVVEGKRRAMEGERQTRLKARLPAELQKAVDAELDAWRAQGRIRRLWAKDAGLWTKGDESKWLGWLDIAGRELAKAAEYKKLAELAAKFEHVLLLGMGGSSLGPEVFAKTFGRMPGKPQLHVLDSTDPGQIRATQAKIDMKKTLFIVASKSGSTLEPNIFKQYFFDQAVKALGPKDAPKRFVAVTDPGSEVQKIAESEGFAQVHHGEPTIGGRYSVLSAFGLVPAAAMGVDIERFLRAAMLTVRSSGPDVPPKINPGVQLGAILGVSGRMGRDKVTVLAGPGLEDFGAWAEQLIAESTGKFGKGLVPIDGEIVGAPAVYGKDRVFVHLSLTNRADPQEAKIAALEAAGNPVVRITMANPYQLGQEFFRWELATAVAGAILGIHPFDQPDVEASKIATRGLTEAYEKSGSLPAETPILVEGGVKLFADAKNAAALAQAAKAKTLDAYLKAHFARLSPGDYAALLAYIPRNAETIAVMQEARHAVRDARKVATVAEFGPRFLHSTGQAYKGGPNSGVFLQVTCDDANDLPVPGQKYTFGVVKAAQARGDFDVLAERGRRALRVHLGANLGAELDKLNKAIRRAVA
jgi:transaldolase/glucose-6-phosphate isomerase